MTKYFHKIFKIETNKVQLEDFQVFFIPLSKLTVDKILKVNRKMGNMKKRNCKRFYNKFTVKKK